MIQFGSNFNTSCKEPQPTEGLGSENKTNCEMSTPPKQQQFYLNRDTWVLLVNRTTSFMTLGHLYFISVLVFCLLLCVLLGTEWCSRPCVSVLPWLFLVMHIWLVPREG